MKKVAFYALCVLLMIGMLIPAAQADQMLTLEYPVEYKYDMAREQLKMVNDFRQSGSDAWEWNESDSEKIFHTNLGTLTLDPALEEVAMLRAAELAAKYSHTRPDGTSWRTAFPFSDAAMGENIAIGQRTAANVFEVWQETNEKYAGQGHRRNMLNKDFTHVGFGCVCVNGFYYWAQEFGGKSGGAERNLLSNTVQTSIKESEAENPADVKAAPHVRSGEGQRNGQYSRADRLRRKDRHPV